MSPEQAQGHRPAHLPTSSRSASLLYELATGRRPFSWRRQDRACSPRFCPEHPVPLVATRPGDSCLVLTHSFFACSPRIPSAAAVSARRWSASSGLVGTSESLTDQPRPPASPSGGRWAARVERAELRNAFTPRSRRRGIGRRRLLASQASARRAWSRTFRGGRSRPDRPIIASRQVLGAARRHGSLPAGARGAGQPASWQARPIRSTG